MKKLSVILIALMIPFYSCGQKEAVSLPTITLIGPLEVFFDLNASYIEFGYKAYDFAGNDISDLVVRDTSSLNMAEAGTYRVSYTAVDRLGNKSTPIYRTVRVGSGQSPVITVSGENPLLLSLNAEFSVPTATAVGSDGKTDLSDSVTVNAESVNTSVPGTYSVYYTVTDVSGIVGMTELTVYVLESDTPRIVVSGKGTSADDPLVIEQLVIQQTTPTDDDLNNAREALTKALPTIKAYDLEDGDISYRVSIVEDDIYNQILNAICLGGSVTDPLTLTVSDEDGHSSSISIYVTVAEDMTPPVIYIENEKPVYEIEIDMWTDQWDKEWGSATGILGGLTIYVTDDNGVTVDAFAKNGTAESPGATDLSKIQCWIEYPDVINSNTQEVYPDSDLETTLKHSKGANTNCYYYQTPNHEINTKTVLLKAQDAAGNIGEKSIKVFLKDTTAPVISTTEVTVAFGATQYSYSVKDNSGYTETKSSNIPSYKTSVGEYPLMSLIEGQFVNQILFSATDSSNNSKSQYGTLKVTPPDTSNLFPYGNFTGSQQTPAGDAIKDTINLGSDTTYHSPDGWQLKAYDGSDPKDNAAFMTSHAKAGLILGMLHGYSGYLICGTVCRGNKYAYATTGFRAYKSGVYEDRKITSMSLGLQASASMVLYNTVTYSFSYDSVDFHTSGGSGTFVPGNRNMTFTVLTGDGQLDGKSSVVIERLAQCDATDVYLCDAMDSGNWKTTSVTATVSGGNISAISVLFSIGKPGVNYKNPDTDADYGTLTNNVTIKAVNWNKLQADGLVAPANPSGS